MNVQMVEFLLKNSISKFGFILSWAPRPILNVICKLLACLTFILLPSRRKLIANNVVGAFPEYSVSGRLKLILSSISHSIEQGLMLLAWPHLKKNQLRLMFPLSSENQKKLLDHAISAEGTLWLIPHFCHADALSFIPDYLDAKSRVHALYRPLRNKVIDSMVRKSRERFQVVTIGRKDGGMLKTLRVLKNGETLAMLFDQNAGGAGTRLTFMRRECSCTTLPDILYEKYKPKVLFVYTRRTGFWQSSLNVEEMDELKDGELLIEKANRWLEFKLRNDKLLRETWLWMHQRWKSGVGQPRKGKIR